MVCRSHYTVDVIMGFYMSHYLSDQYFLRADGVMPNRWGARWVRYFEGHDLTQKGLSERATSMASFASMASFGGANAGSFGNLDKIPIGLERGPSGLDMVNLQRANSSNSYGEMGLSASDKEFWVDPANGVTESPFHPASVKRSTSAGPPSI